MLTIANTSGLLFERLFWLSAIEAVHAWLHPAQTGYRYSCEDHMLVLYSMAAHRQALEMPMWIVLADLVKAFPSVWREYLVLQAASCLTETW